MRDGSTRQRKYKHSLLQRQESERWEADRRNEKRRVERRRGKKGSKSVESVREKGEA